MRTLQKRGLAAYILQRAGVLQTFWQVLLVVMTRASLDVNHSRVDHDSAVTSPALGLNRAHPFRDTPRAESLG
jgi:hypothetical protein